MPPLKIKKIEGEQVQSQVDLLARKSTKGVPSILDIDELTFEQIREMKLSQVFLPSLAVTLAFREDSVAGVEELLDVWNYSSAYAGTQLLNRSPKLSRDKMLVARKTAPLPLSAPAQAYISRRKTHVKVRVTASNEVSWWKKIGVDYEIRIDHSWRLVDLKPADGNTFLTTKRYRSFIQELVVEYLLERMVLDRKIRAARAAGMIYKELEDPYYTGRTLTEEADGEGDSDSESIDGIAYGSDDGSISSD